MRFLAPDENALTHVLAMIAGAEVSGRVSGVAPRETAYAGVFVDEAGNVVASCDCDMTTAAALGCALSMIPPAQARSMVEDGALTAMATENLHELMNMFSSLMMSDDTAHLRLARLERVAPELADGTRKSACYALDLGRYGTGSLRFRLA